MREALERAGYDDASVEHISYAQCALLDETVMSRKSEKGEEGEEPKVDEGQVAWRKAPLQARFLAHSGLAKRCGIGLQRFCVSPHLTRPF